MWATERKNLPVKDVAAAGGGKDIMTLMECIQQPEEESLRSVVEYRKPKRISGFGGGASLASETRTQTHTGPQIGKAPPPGNPMRRFQLPLLGSNQDSPDPEGPL